MSPEPGEDQQASSFQSNSAQHGGVRLSWLRPNVLRVTHFPSGELREWQDPLWLEDVFLPGALQASPALKPELTVEVRQGCVWAWRIGEDRSSNPPYFCEAWPARLGLRRRRLEFELDIPKVEVRLKGYQVEQGVNLALQIQADETFWGWGEWFNAFQRRQGEVELRIRDAIALLQDRHTYSAIPAFYSSRGYAFFLLNSFTSRWRILPQRRVLEVEADGPGADYLLIYGPGFKRILETYTGLTGRPPLLPRWAFGLWTTCYPQVSQDEVLAHVQEHRRRGIPLDVVILDYHWEEKFHNFRWRKRLFPNAGDMIRQLGELGIHLGCIQTPFVNCRQRPFQKWFLNTLAHNIPKGCEADNETPLELYNEGLQKGYYAHPQARWWFGVGGMVDFANPQAAEWWNRLMQPLYQQGVAFFKNDDGEYLPEDARSAREAGPNRPLTGMEYHNLYGFYYGRALYEGLATLKPGQRPLIYARSVWAGSQRFPALFLGDQKPTYQGIRSTLRAGLNLGLLGFAYWTADVFGLDGKTDPERHMRYAQWALLNPVARYFWRPAEIDDSRFPWSHGDEVEANFRKYAQLRYRLLPYFAFLAFQAWQGGLPLLRPLCLEFDDPEQRSWLAGIDDQVMLGSNLMLAPIIKPGALSRRIVLPPGVWHDFWTEQSWQGPDEIEYTAPLDRLPLLVQGGTILPLGPALDFIPKDHRFDQLELHIWPPFPAQGWLYDDDGQTTAYQHDAFSITHFHAAPLDGDLVLRIGVAQGGFPEQVAERQIKLIWHHLDPPGRLQCAGHELTEFDYQTDLHQLSFSLRCPTDRATEVCIKGVRTTLGGKYDQSR